MKERVDMAELQEQHLDMMIKLAFDMEDAAEVQRILEEPDPDLTEDEVSFTNVLFLDAWNASERKIKNEKRQRFAASLRKVMPRFIEVAACLILIIAFVTPVALASSASFRAKVMQLLMELDNEKEEVYFTFTEDESAEFWVPEGWTGTCYPSYVPEGYEVYSFIPLLSSIEYRDPVGNQLYFDEYSDNSDMMVGTENCSVSTIAINGHNGYIVDGLAADGMTHSVTIVWQGDSKWYCVSGFGISTNDAILVATSVKEVIR